MDLLPFLRTSRELNASLTKPQIYRLLFCYAIACSMHALNIPLWMVGFVAGMLWWRTSIEHSASALPSSLIRNSLLAVVFFGTFLHFGTLGGRDPGTTLMAGALAIKLLELSTVRDYMVMIFLLYFFTIITLLFDQSIFLFLFVLVVLAFLTSVLLKFHFGDKAGPQPVGLIRYAGGLVLQALPLAVILFLIFPRVQGQFGFSFGMSKTGLSDSMSPGSVLGLIFDDSLAFRVDFPNGEQPDTNDLYWRAFNFWHYNAEAGRWYRKPPMQRVPRIRQRIVGGRSIVQRITVMPHYESWLFALDYPVQPPRGTEMTAGNNLALQSPQWKRRLNADAKLFRKFQYTIESQLGGIPTEIDWLQWHAATSIDYRDAIHPDVIALATQWREAATQPNGSVDEAKIVQAAINFFREGGFRYTTTPATYSQGWLREFLFDRKLGFCEHYASAFAVLMRLADVPSRVVAGYHGGSYNPYGNFLVVRQSQAHAWNEVYLDEKGWLRVDLTTQLSPTRLSDGVEQIRDAQSSRLRVNIAGDQYELRYDDWVPEWIDSTLTEADLRWQQVNYMWDEIVLAYDQETQIRLLSAAGIDRSNLFLFVFFGLIGVVATAYGVYYFLRIRDAQSSPIDQIYQAFCKDVAIAGVPREPWEGPVDFANRASSSLPRAAPAIMTFARTYSQICYGKPSKEVAKGNPERAKATNTANDQTPTQETVLAELRRQHVAVQELLIEELTDSERNTGKEGNDLPQPSQGQDDPSLSERLDRT